MRRREFITLIGGAPASLGVKSRSLSLSVRLSG
jgi:hypothetical protein